MNAMAWTMAIDGKTTQNTLGYVLSWATTSSNVPFVSLPTSNYTGTQVLSQSVVTPIYGPVMSVAPNQIVHATRSMPASSGSSDRKILQAYWPVSGSMANANVNLPVMWSNELDPVLFQTSDNTLSPTDPLYLKFPYTQSSAAPTLFY